MSHHRILKPSFIREDERGAFRELLNIGQWESLVQGDMHAGAVLGNHYHKETRIFFMLLGGRTRIETRHAETNTRDMFELGPFEGCYFELYESHKITFLEPGSFIFLKDKQYDPANDDIHHLEV
ncbi:MAG: hypothetical protein ACLFTK_05555 [Anaerolineales bacterium]